MLNKIILTSAIIFFSIFFITCGSDTPTSNNNTGGGTVGPYPRFNLRTGSTFIYTNDSLPNGGSPIRTRIITNDSILTPVTLAGFLCFPIRSTSVDTVTNQTQIDTAFVRYDSTGGKFYQYGIRKLIDTTQPGTWDLVADFSVPRTTEWLVANIVYTYTIPGFGTVTFSGPLKGKVADSTTIQTTSNPPQTIHCYKIQLTATLSGSLFVTISTTIVIDYYLAFTAVGNPTGLARLWLNPFTFTTTPNIGSFPYPGFDRILRNYTIAP